MKKIFKHLCLLTLLLAVCVCFASCDDLEIMGNLMDPENVESMIKEDLAITQDDGSEETSENSESEPIDGETTDGETNNGETTDGGTTDSGTTDGATSDDGGDQGNSGGIANGGANTEGGWGPIIRPRTVS